MNPSTHLPSRRKPGSMVPQASVPESYFPRGRIVLFSAAFAASKWVPAFAGMAGWEAVQ